MTRLAPKRKRGRPRTHRHGYKVTMLPTTYQRLSGISQAYGMRLGAWLDSGVEVGLVIPPGKAVPALRHIVRTIVSLIAQLDENITEDLAKDEAVVTELRELAGAVPFLLDVLKDAGLVIPKRH